MGSFLLFTSIYLLIINKFIEVKHYNFLKALSVLLIFADDLTGALDATAPFAGRGLVTEVAIGLDGVRAALANGPAVLGVNLGCRDGEADEACRRTRELMGLVPAGTFLFKKIDSRLKGHIAAEMDAISYRQALVAPAIPDFGRVVTGEPCPVSASKPPFRFMGSLAVMPAAARYPIRIHRRMSEKHSSRHRRKESIFWSARVGLPKRLRRR